MKLKGYHTFGRVRPRIQKVTMVALLVIIITGVALALYRVDESSVNTVQAGQTIETVGLSSTLRGNSSKSLGPIPAVQGSWFGVAVGSNKSISLLIGSNSSRPVLNSTGTEFDTVVPLFNSTNYYVTATNSKGATAVINGNVTLVILSSENFPAVVAKHPLLIPGTALSIFGAVALLYIALPREPGQRRSYERLFP